MGKVDLYGDETNETIKAIWGPGVSDHSLRIELYKDGEKFSTLKPHGIQPNFKLEDLDGDGKLELAAPFPNGFRCYDAATGELEWTVEIPPGPYAATFSADLSGDGRDEFFFAADNRLVAVAADQDGGKIAWQVALPGRLSEPSFADVDADGKGEILVTCADGNLYCLDQASGR